MNDKVAKEIDVVLRLHNVTCPNNCDNGIIYHSWTETFPACCGHFHDNGECCNDPVPTAELHTVEEPCGWCYDINTLKEKNEVDNDALQELIKAAK